MASDLTAESTSRSVITIASGNKTYIDMACNLAMSFFLWNKANNIKFYLVTDKPSFIPDYLKGKIEIIQKRADQLKNGFSAKLDIFNFIQTEETLFIDADCLIYGSLIPVFDSFKTHSVSAIGYKRYEGANVGFCHNILETLENLKIPYFPLLCGSVYYIKKNNIASDIFDYANQLLPQYDNLGLVRLRGKENEEPLIAISMAKFNQSPINDTGFIKADRMFYEHIFSNVLIGKARLWNTDRIPIPEYSTLKNATPLIVHFNAAHAETFEYESEVIRLQKTYRGWNNFFTELYTSLYSIIPGKLILLSKNTFRPIYRTIFGTRKIKTSKRM